MPKLYRLLFYSAVKKNFSAICRLLGDGYVVRTSIYTGKNFRRLKPGKIYKCPARGRVRHAIVLIGAGRRGTIEYYHFLNSWGELFHLRILKGGFRVGKPKLRSSHKNRKAEKACGGFGLLRASDIRTRPVTFLRHEDDFKYYKPLLHKYVVPLGKTKEGPEKASIIPCWGAPQPSNTCSRTSEPRDSICQKMKEEISLLERPAQVLVSNEPKQQSAEPVHVIMCSPSDEVFVDCSGGYLAGHEFRFAISITQVPYVSAFNTSQKAGEERGERAEWGGAGAGASSTRSMGLTIQPWQI